VTDQSKYPIQYWSASKGAHHNIEDMHSSHLGNAYRKALVSSTDDEAIGGAPLGMAHYMAEELRSRGATVDGATVTWPTREGDPADERTS
jgi:hypothetical protein